MKNYSSSSLPIIISIVSTLFFSSSGMAQLAQSSWPSFGRDLKNSSNVPFAAPIISPSSPDSVFWGNENIKSRYPTAVTDGKGRIYVGIDGTFYALDSSNGKVIWERKIDGNIRFTPAINKFGVVFFGTSYSGRFEQEYIYAINGNTGNIKWKHKYDNVYSFKIDNDDNILIGSQGYLNAINSSNGDTLWRFRTGLEIHTAPAVDENGTIYIAGHTQNKNNGYIYAIDSNHKLKWRYKVGNIIDSEAAPTIGPKGNIYVASHSRLCSINKEGVLNWEFSRGHNFTTSPAINNEGILYIGQTDFQTSPYSDDYYFYSINSNNGNVIWDLKLGGSIANSPIIDKSGNLVLNTQSDDYLYVISKNGSILWRKKIYISDAQPILLPRQRILLQNHNRMYVVGQKDSSKTKEHQMSVSLLRNPNKSFVNEWDALGSVPDVEYLDEINYQQSNLLIPVKLKPKNDEVLTNVKLQAVLGESDTMKVVLTDRIDSNDDGLIDNVPNKNISSVYNIDYLSLFIISNNRYVNGFNDKPVKVKVTSVNGTPVQIVYRDTVSMYPAKYYKEPRTFDLGKDAYRFHNLGSLSFSEFYNIYYEKGLLKGALSLLYRESKLWAGRCFGMATTTGNYFAGNKAKPLAGMPHDWDSEKFQVREQITNSHLAQFYMDMNLPEANMAEEYTKLRSKLKEDKKPAVLAISTARDSLVNAHAVLGTKLTEFKYAKVGLIDIYENNRPDTLKMAAFNMQDNSLVYNIKNVRQYKKFITVYLDDIPVDLREAYDFMTDNIWTKVRKLSEGSVKKVFAVFGNSNGSQPKNFSASMPQPSVIIENTQGQQFGFRSDGTLVSEIRGASYEKIEANKATKDSLIFIYAPREQSYSAKVTTKTNGHLSFEYLSPDDNGRVDISRTDSVTMTDQTVVSFDDSQNSVLNVDENGDGETDQTISLTQTTVGTEKVEAIPKHYILSPNYPNPFNPTTTIKFELPQATEVNLAVYNAVGRRVATLVNKPMQAGSHAVTFDGEGLPSGVYIYRIETGEYREARKMLLLK